MAAIQARSHFALLINFTIFSPGKIISMKHNQLFLLSVLLIFSSSIFAQKEKSIQLRNGVVNIESNICKHILDSFNTHAVRYQQKALAVLQFESLPSEEAKNFLSQNGIELLQYIPNNSYTVTISKNLDSGILQQAKARSVFQLAPQQKMETKLAQGIVPPFAVKVAGTVDVWISFPKTFSLTEVVIGLKQLNFDLTSAKLQAYRILEVRIAFNRLKELAALPFVEYVQTIPSGDQPLNYNSRFGSRANFLNASLADGGKGLNGEGVVLGIGDNADVQTHVDFAARLINRAPEPITAGHGHHTTGTMAGAGNIVELYRGYAPKATIISQGFNGIILNAPTYVNDYGMVVTNNSYGDIIDCSYYGTYDLTSQLLDQMAFDLPNLSNVFAAGNSGTASCTPFQATYHTVLGGYQSSKNVVTVGATNDSGAVAAFSSRGPVKDGRVKPDLTAMGQGVASDWFNNGYSYNNGTSMAAPAVSGGLALLYQRYRQINSGSNPKNGLMKAILCNGASDRGNAGPDYQYGYGWMNLFRSIGMIENNLYFNSAVTNGSTNTHTITVPVNTAQLKVMLYWNDPAASPLSAKTLVNDLDLEVTDPSSTTNFPKILDTSNANLNNAAVTGADHLNNIEQVVINNPTAGSYTLKVKGTAIAQNPSQEYFLVYDPIPVQLKITAPVGGEGLAPTTGPYDISKISWDAYGLTGTVHIDFSTDGGATWSSIAAGVDVNRVVYSWSVPNVSTSQALVRITKDVTGETTTSNIFTITGIPAVSLASTQCEGYININWNAVAGATDYEVMMLQGDDMKPITTTTATSYTFSGLSKDSVYWVTVRARVNGKPGRRTDAVRRQPNDGTCSGSISDNDLKIDAIIAPTSGRKFTSTQLNAATPITVRIKNLDDASVTNFDLKYSINGSAFVTENVTSTVAAGATFTYTFNATADLSTIGNYNLIVVVKNAVADAATTNDTATTLVRHVDNQPLNLSSYFLDNLETAAPATYQKDTVALNGLDRYDFSRLSVYGRLRTFINSGIAYSGNKAITLDASQYYPAGNVNYLYGTFNLINYNANINDIRLDFQYNNHGQFPDTNNKVWIRGADSQPWIAVYNLNDNQNDPGIYKKTSSIELSRFLSANGQSFSPSVQVRWGQWGQIAATDKQAAGGYTFDDIRVYEVFNDLQMLSIDAPLKASCGLTNATSIKVSVRNSANNAISNIAVRYRINNGAWISETIPSIAANTTVQYNFTTTADLSGLSTYSIQAIVDYTSDSFKENDTTATTVINSPIISSYPYLQNFETSNGYWYTDGINSSWQYGTPASQKINRAASGAKAWKTRLAGNYNDLEQSYLYSPCFDISAMTNPTLSFSVALDLEDCGSQLCDGAWVEYSADGVAWTKLGVQGQGTNWYNKASGQLWSIIGYTNWHVATIPLPTGLNRLRIRLVMASDPAANYEGIAIDDIHIYDNIKGIYTGPTMTTPVSQTVSGNNWIDFTSGGQLIASIQPNNTTLGSTDVQAYMNTGAVRFTTRQYYGDRNITIKPANTLLADSATVRFYFLDPEVNSMLTATGCPSCTKPTSAYELGVSEYSDADTSFENGSINDNQQGIWNYIASNNLSMVPFDKGYYAEFKVKDFSEFWLNNGGFDKSSPLPVKMLNFTAQKINVNDVRLKWTVGSETNVSKYEIEVARGNAQLQAGYFVKIGEVASLGNSTSSRNYSFTDVEADKFGVRYYRLKTINIDGSFSYSVLRSIVFSNAIVWQVYPNPSNGLFTLVFQINSNEKIEARVIDAKGSLVAEYTKAGNGFPQKLNINLLSQTTGVYLLQINAAGKKQTFKLYKN